MKTIKTQGVEIPRLGFGTFRMPGGDSQPVVESAIALGFRHIDTAAMDMEMAATLEALMELRERGLTRAIGVCNSTCR